MLLLLSLCSGSGWSLWKKHGNLTCSYTNKVNAPINYIHASSERRGPMIPSPFHNKVLMPNRASNLSYKVINLIRKDGAPRNQLISHLIPLYEEMRFISLSTFVVYWSWQAEHTRPKCKLTLASVKFPAGWDGNSFEVKRTYVAREGWVWFSLELPAQDHKQFSYDHLETAFTSLLVGVEQAYELCRLMRMLCLCLHYFVEAVLQNSNQRGSSVCISFSFTVSFLYMTSSQYPFH